MKTIQLAHYGLAGLRVVDSASPGARANELVVTSAYSSINPVDLETALGKNKALMPFRPPFTPGVDVVGVVKEVGEAVDGFSVGDRVVAYSGVPVAGAWSEEVRVRASGAAVLPVAAEPEQAAAFCLAGLAGATALDHLGLRKGQRVLVHGAAGAVGSTAAQLALAQGLAVVANVHSRDADRVRAWGVNEVHCYDRGSFADHCDPVDGVVDTVGGATYRRSFSVVRSGGVIASLTAVPSPSRLKQAGFSVPWWMGPILRIASAPVEKRGVRIHPVVTTPNASNLARVMERLAQGVLRADIAEVCAPSGVSRVLSAQAAGELRGKCLIRFGA